MQSSYLAFQPGGLPEISWWRKPSDHYKNINGAERELRIYSVARPGLILLFMHQLVASASLCLASLFELSR